MTPTPEQIAQWAREADEYAFKNAIGFERRSKLFDAHLVSLACAWYAEQDAKRVRELEASLYELRDLLKRRPALSSNMAAEYLLWSNSVYQLSAMNAVDAASVKGNTCQN